jgi:hypothetical protein
MKGEIKSPWWKCRSRSSPSNPETASSSSGYNGRSGDFKLCNNGGERVEDVIFTGGGRILFIPLSDF